MTGEEIVNGVCKFVVWGVFTFLLFVFSVALALAWERWENKK